MAFKNDCPILLNSPPLKNFTEETSEYHKYNIDNYPEHKKVMEKFVSISAERHKEFEKNHKSKKHHLLDLNKYISSNSSIENKSDVVDNLKKLNDGMENKPIIKIIVAVYLR